MSERVVNQKVTSKRKSLWRRIFTPRMVFFFGLLVLAATICLAYFYVIFSEVIDAKLQGAIFVRDTGIYTAPVKILTNQALKKTDLTAYLDHIGYLAGDKPRETNRGYYAVKDNTVEIEPSETTYIDNGRLFPHLRIKFSDDGQVVRTITDLEENKTKTDSLIEPELLTSVNQDKEKRKIVEYKDIPDNLVKAIVAIEDRRFFDHPGIDFRGLFRAVWRNLSGGELQQGGSTITQQLVKNFFLTPEKTMKRKLSEIFISILLETRMTKEQIFQMYCNEIPLGQDGNYSINGIGEAASFYFNKDVAQLNLSEACFIAGIIRGHTYYSPFKHPERAIERRNQVLEAMVAAQFLDPKTAEEIKTTDLKVRPKSSSSNAEAPYFLDYLQAQVNDTLGDQIFSQQSYRIYSTINMDLQRAADQAVRNGLAQIEKNYSKRIAPNSLQAALIALNAKTGEILAMVGGRDYSTSQLNRVIDAHRQPGSVFKPIVYTTALNTAYDQKTDSILTPASEFLDEKTSFNFGEGKTYEPDNYGEKYSGHNVTMRYALTHSLNVVTVKVAEKVGFVKVAQMAERLGLPKPKPFPALALGTAEATPLEMARVYTTFPNLGMRVEPYAIGRVVNSDSKTIYQGATKSQQAISPQVAYIMTTILQDVLNKGTAASARTAGFNSLAAGKTGTSRDGWFAGFTPNMVCVVYVGFDDNTQLGIEGAKSALPIWVDFMKKAVTRHPELAGNEFAKPKSGITSINIDPQTGLVANENCATNAYEEYFITGTEPTETCSAGIVPTPTSEDEDGFPSDTKGVILQPPTPTMPDESEGNHRGRIRSILGKIFKPEHSNPKP